MDGKGRGQTFIGIAATLLDAVFRFGVAAIFVYAGWTKIGDPSAFAASVDGYRLLPAPLVGIFALVLPMLEIVAGLTMAFTRLTCESALTLLGLLGMFFIGLTQAAVRGLDISCGCFGTGDGDTIGAAIARDVVLFVPVVWLLVRGNRPLWPRFTGRVATVLFCLLVAACDGEVGKAVPPPVKPSVPPAASSVASNQVSVARWTLDFPQAMEKARAAQVPLLMVVTAEKCEYCKRLKRVLADRPFREWAAAAGLYLAEARTYETNSSPAQAELADFVWKSPRIRELTGYPQIAVYWNDGEGNETWAAFSGRRWLMPSEGNPTLSLELINSLEMVLADYFSSLPARPRLEEIYARAGKTISAGVNGEGTVKVTPPDGRVRDDGSSVSLLAKPAKGWKFAGWRNPAGKMIKGGNAFGGGKGLVVDYYMHEGEYTAIFRKK